MAIVNSFHQVRAVKVEQFFQGRPRLNFRLFFELPELIFEPCRPLKGLKSLLMHFIGNSGKGSSLAIPSSG
jgi:hypothetical protein